jgi:hypothetical protein
MEKTHIHKQLQRQKYLMFLALKKHANNVRRLPDLRRLPLVVRAVSLKEP